MNSYLVQYGSLSNLAACHAVDGQVFRRGDVVVLRTIRGLELGNVLDKTAESPNPKSSAGTILRRFNRQDELLRERLQRNHAAAMAACSDALAESHPHLLLVDAEVLFDGQTLLFYFLGELSAEEEAIVTEELSDTYHRASGLDKFAKTLAEGCGPTCGTGESGCSTGTEGGKGGCATCAVGCRR